MVASAWREGEGSTPMGEVVNKVGKCQMKLKWWSKCYFKNVTWEIGEKKEEIERGRSFSLKG